MPISVAHIITNWKTTAQGFLSLIAVGAVALQGMNLPLFSPKINAGIAVAAALSKAYIGMIQKDSGVETVKTADGKVQDEPSHEVPDDPTSKAVKQ